MPRHPSPPPPLPAWGEKAPHLVDKSRLALELEVQPSAVSNWVKRGLPVRDDGLVDLAVAVKWIQDNLDTMAAYRTRVQAHEVRTWIFAMAQERWLVQFGAEHAGAAAYQCAHALGLGDRAEELAEAVTNAMVTRMNPALVNEGNNPLPAPPAGVWRERLAVEKVAEVAEVAL